jgi:predicted RNase H-like HicB family nuclease
MMNTIPRRLYKSLRTSQTLSISVIAFSEIHSIGCGLKMKIPVILSLGEDGFIVATCPVLPGCVSQGMTKEEALSNIAEAIYGCINVRREIGLNDYEELLEVEVII